MKHDGLARWAGPAGLAFAISVLAQNLFAQAAHIEPKNDANGATIVAKFADQAGAIGALVGWVALNMVILGVFLAAAYSRFRTTGPGWSRLALIGGIMLMALEPLVNVPLIVLAVNGDKLADSPRLAEVLWQLHLAIFGYEGIALGLTLLGVTMAAVAAGHAPRWFGSLATLGAASLVLASTLVQPITDGSAVTFVGAIGFVIWLVVLAVISVNLWRQAPRESEVIPAPV